MIERLHGVIRSIFVQLRHADDSASAAVISVHSVQILNDIYPTDVVSSF